MDNYNAEQRESVRQLVHAVLTCDMGRFNPERFKGWIKEIDACFRKVGLALRFEPHNRSVHFTIKEIATGNAAFRFTLPTRVRFDDKDVVGSAEELV